MAPVVPLLLAGGKLGLKLLPAIGATAGALPGLRRGNIGEALLGGGVGALTGGLGTGGAIKGLTKGGMRMAGGMGAQNLLGTAAGQIGGLGAQKAVMGALTPQVLTKAARVGIPLAGVGAVAKAAGGFGGGGSAASAPVLGGAAGLIGYGAIGNEGLGGVPLPPGVGPYGTIGPTGLPLDVLSPLGLDAGRRLRTQKDAESLRDATNIVLPTIRKFSEQAKKDDFARNMASYGIQQNIATNAALTQGMAQATRQMGTKAAEQAGTALITKYNY